MSQSSNHTLSDQEDSSDDAENDMLALQLLRVSPRASSPAAAPVGSSLRGRQQQHQQQQDATKTCRLLALEVGSLKAELTREQKKRAQAVHRANKAESGQQQAEQRLHELQYSNNKLQQELDAVKQASDSSNRRIQSLRQSLADAETEARDRMTLGQQQVRRLCYQALSACMIQAGMQQQDSPLPLHLPNVISCS